MPVAKEDLLMRPLRQAQEPDPSVAQLFVELEHHSPETWTDDVSARHQEASAYAATLSALLLRAAQHPQAPGLLRQIGQKVARHCSACILLVVAILGAGCASVPEPPPIPDEVIGTTVCLSAMDFATAAVHEGYTFVPKEDVREKFGSSFPDDLVWVKRPAPWNVLGDGWITVHQFGYSPDSAGNMCSRIFLQYPEEQPIQYS